MVRNEKAGAWSEAEQWRVTERLRIGSAGGGVEEGLFSGRLVSPSFGPNGQIFVLDFQANRIFVFDDTGEFVRTISQPGRGPGDLYGPAAMVWDSRDRLWVAEALNRRYQIFDSVGNHLKTVPRPVTIANRLQHRLVASGSSAFVDEGAERGIAQIIRVDTLGVVIDSLVHLVKPTRPSFGPILPNQDMLRRVVRYLPSLDWSIAADETVWASRTDQLRLIQFSSIGDTIRVVETRHRSSELTDEDQRVIEAGLREGRISRDGMSLVRPVVNGVYAMPDGHVLVGIVDEVGEDSRYFDVFNPEGVFLGTLDFGFRWVSQSIPDFSGDEFLAVTLDEFDVPYVVRGTIERR